MPLRTAYKLCPQTIFLPVDYEAYEAASRAFKAVLLDVTSVIVDIGIDEVCLDISDALDANEAIVEKIKSRIREKQD
jgi:DNA polymerase-4